MKILNKKVNQYEGNSSKMPAMKYKPSNISELTAFTAAVRPSFKSLFNHFVKREAFDYGIKTLDNILQTDSFKYSFILYQENIMAILQHAGIPSTSSYEVIKAISKKKIKVIMDAKKSFTEGFEKALLKDDRTLTSERAKEVCDSVWEIIENASKYGLAK